MKRLIVFIIGFVLIIPASYGFEVSDACKDSWSAAFDEADKMLYATSEMMMKQNNKASSDLAEAMPQILRTYRCHLKQICYLTSHVDYKPLKERLAKQFDEEEQEVDFESYYDDFLNTTIQKINTARESMSTSGTETLEAKPLSEIASDVSNLFTTETSELMEFSISTSDSPEEIMKKYFVDQKVEILGCEQGTVGQVIMLFPIDPKACFIGGQDNKIKFEIYNMCQMHADFNINRAKIVLPVLIQKDSIRKQVGFIYYKLMDMTERFKGFFYEMGTYNNKITKIIKSIKCITAKCD